MDSLRGKLLLAGPLLKDPHFDRSVVLVTEHTEEGAMGLILNRRSETAIDEAVPDLAWVAEADDRVYVGGPVAPEGVIVLAEWSDPELAVVLLDDDLGFVPGAGDADPGVLAEAVRRARVYAGHAGWGPGQLEAELEEEAWIVAEPQREELFSEDPDGLWAAVLRRKGRAFALLSTMPPDPSLN